MKDRQFKVAIARFPYGGNGGVSSEVPDIGDWLVKTVIDAKADPRVQDIFSFRVSDTPITMTRNRAVKTAREAGVDVLVMIDSDMNPDIHRARAGSQLFWNSSFDFLVKHYERGPVVIGAPYCGPPPFENVYVFEWKGFETDTPNDHLSLDAYTREQAAVLGGIQPCAALPTGLIMYDMRIFDILKPPYFSYEWTDETQSEKASTEDVMATRDMHLRGLELLGYNPVFCNWDAWAGHWKPKCVGKPNLLAAEQVSEKYRAAAARETRSDEQLLDVGAGGYALNRPEAVVLRGTPVTPPSETPHGREQENKNREATGAEEINQTWPKSDPTV